MPPLVAAFFALQALHIPTLVGAVQGVDPSARLQTEKTAVAYNVWTAPRWEMWADDNGECRFRLFAVVAGRGLTRCRIGGTEQLLDTSWTFDYTAHETQQVNIPVVFLDPVGGETLKRVDRWFYCRQRLPGPRRITAADLGGWQ